MVYGVGVGGAFPTSAEDHAQGQLSPQHVGDRPDMLGYPAALQFGGRSNHYFSGPPSYGGGMPNNLQYGPSGRGPREGVHPDSWGYSVPARLSGLALEGASGGQPGAMGPRPPYSGRPSGKLMGQSKFKTRLCSFFMGSNGAHCPHGNDCQFAHGYIDIRLPGPPGAASLPAPPHLVDAMMRAANARAAAGAPVSVLEDPMAMLHSAYGGVPGGYAEAMGFHAYRGPPRGPPMLIHSHNGPRPHMGQDPNMGYGYGYHGPIRGHGGDGYGYLPDPSGPYDHAMGNAHQGLGSYRQAAGSTGGGYGGPRGMFVPHQHIDTAQAQMASPVAMASRLPAGPSGQGLRVNANGAPLGSALNPDSDAFADAYTAGIVAGMEMVNGGIGGHNLSSVTSGGPAASAGAQTQAQQDMVAMLDSLSSMKLGGVY